MLPSKHVASEQRSAATVVSYLGIDRISTSATHQHRARAHREAALHSKEMEIARGLFRRAGV
jgi:hypothetical protein